MYKERKQREAVSYARVSTAGSAAGVDPAATDGAVRDGDAAASSNTRSLSNEHEGKESSQRRPECSRTELRTKRKDDHRAKKRKRLEKQT